MRSLAVAIGTAASNHSPRFLVDVDDIEDHMVRSQELTLALGMRPGSRNMECVGFASLTDEKALHVGDTVLTMRYLRGTVVAPDVGGLGLTAAMFQRGLAADLLVAHTQNPVVYRAMEKCGGILFPSRDHSIRVRSEVSGQLRSQLTSIGRDTEFNRSTGTTRAIYSRPLYSFPPRHRDANVNSLFETLEARDGLTIIRVRNRSVLDLIAEANG